MLSNEALQAARADTISQTKSGALSIPSNPFFGVGPITDATTDEVHSRLPPSISRIDIPVSEGNQSVVERRSNATKFFAAA